MACRDGQCLPGYGKSRRRGGPSGYGHELVRCRGLYPPLHHMAFAERARFAAALCRRPAQRGFCTPAHRNGMGIRRARPGRLLAASCCCRRIFLPCPLGRARPTTPFTGRNRAHGPRAWQTIGSRKPNPLGIYDTAGNAAEMVLDAFRFSMAGRLHGSAGGFVRKGGSFLSGDARFCRAAGKKCPSFSQTAPHTPAIWVFGP